MNDMDNTTGCNTGVVLLIFLNCTCTNGLIVGLVPALYSLSKRIIVLTSVVVAVWYELSCVVLYCLGVS